VCDACGYSANREIARFQKSAAAEEETPLPVAKVATPDTTTIDALAKFLNIAPERTAKAIFLMATILDGPERSEKFVFAVVRGDMELNEVKLSNAVGAIALRPATEAEIRAIGAAPGYGSPVGVHDCLIVVDDVIGRSANLVAGANEDGYHLLNVNYGRDYQAQIVADIVAARAGDACPTCGQPLKTVRGVEVGNIFKLGTRFTASTDATYVDDEGDNHPIVMGCYGIGLGRLMACVAEAHHDDDGLIWPASIAPYPVHLVALPGGESVADQLYTELQRAGIEVLYDDRDERAGVKFKDADLLGMPLRLTVGERSLASGGVEFKRRDLAERALVPVDSVLSKVRLVLTALQAVLDAPPDVPYKV
jgi:prolyl-tRNA synthetase